MSEDRIYNLEICEDGTVFYYDDPIDTSIMDEYMVEKKHHALKHHTSEEIATMMWHGDLFLCVIAVIVILFTAIM